MSWLFSQALAEAYSAEPCSDGEPFAQLNVMPTPHKFWRKGKTMDCSDHSQFGLTLKVLTPGPGGELLMSYLAASRALTSVQQEKGQELTVNLADYGDTCPELFAMFNPSTSLWKTAQHSLLADSDEFSATWPQWGSMQDGECWQHQKPVLSINENECGSLLPTPSGVNAGRNHTMGRVDEWGGSSNPLRGTVIGSMCLPEFEELVMGWPVMWTALMPFETAKFREWQQQHSPFSATPPESKP